jgi:hypothetical protein
MSEELKMLADVEWLKIGSTDEYAEVKAWIAHICRDVTEASCIDEICIHDICIGLRQKGYEIVAKSEIEQLRAEITRLEGINETALHLLTQYGDKADEMLNLQQKLYPEYERLTAENEKLRRLLDWALHPEAHAALMAEYAKAGKVTEGCESNIPY